MFIQCELCPKGCRIEEGERGNCRIRVNLDGKLRTITYGFPCSVHVDPIEKKPFFHFYPGAKALSLATAGCNLHCKNCQNWEISQANPEDVEAFELNPLDVVNTALKENTPIISYTYTDPMGYYEYTLDMSSAARLQKIKNVLVTAGYIKQETLKKLLAVTDAIKVDLKFFDDGLYRQITTATLKPVLETIATAKKMGVWLEVVNLVIPTLNDDEKQIKAMCDWLVANVGGDVPLHFSRFYPQYLLRNLPSTPYETLKRAKEIAKASGIRYVYIGNVNSVDDETTYCPFDGSVLVKRIGYVIAENNIVNNKCTKCGNEIPGVWGNV